MAATAVKRGEGRPRIGYYDAANKRIPGVTTVISRFKESGGLIHWAWQCGVDGLDYRELRDNAASSGTLAHNMVEAEIHGKPYDASNYDAATVAKATQAFGAFQEWREQTQLEVIHTEVPLISQAHRFGGTLDAMLVHGKLSLGDWKTSNGLYPDHLLQLAAYKILWEENHPDMPIEGGFHLLRFSKEEGDFHHHYFGNLDEAARGFLMMRELYDIMAVLKKRAA